MRKKMTELTPEGAAKIIRGLVDGVKVRDAAHAVELYPALEIGLQGLDKGTANPASHGSGSAVLDRPSW